MLSQFRFDLIEEKNSCIYHILSWVIFRV